MNKEEVQKLAEAIRDGKATKEEKIEFFKFLNLQLEEVSKVLHEAKEHKQ